MEHVLALRADDLVAQRPPGADEDVHFVEAMVEHIVGELSRPGDLVLDPFAGYGTTLVVAERMGRRAVGLELLPERARALRARVGATVRVIEGDARRLAEYLTPQAAVDLCLTSPPYMPATGHPENPLTGYTTLDGDYRRYLAELAAVFTAVAELLVPGGHLVVNAANLLNGTAVTPLAWDIAATIRPPLTFRGEIYLLWDRPAPEVTGDYCLVYRKAGRRRS